LNGRRGDKGNEVDDELLDRRVKTEREGARRGPTRSWGGTRTEKATNKTEWRQAKYFRQEKTHKGG